MTIYVLIELESLKFYPIDLGLFRHLRYLAFIKYICGLATGIVGYIQATRDLEQPEAQQEELQWNETVADRLKKHCIRLKQERDILLEGTEAAQEATVIDWCGQTPDKNIVI